MTPDERADRMLPMAEALVQSVENREPENVRRVFDAADIPAMIVVLAQMVIDARADEERALQAAYATKNVRVVGMTPEKALQIVKQTRKGKK